MGASNSESEVYNEWKQSSQIIPSHSPCRRRKYTNYTEGRATLLRLQITQSSLRVLTYCEQALHKFMGQK